jgi:hypothetical protein
LKPSSSVDDMGLVGLLLLGVATLRVAVLPLLPDGVIVPLPLPLPEGLGGASGTLGCVSVSDSAACTSPLPLPLILLLLLLLLMPSLLGPATRLGHRPVHAAFCELCNRAAPRTLLPCISAWRTPAQDRFDARACDRERGWSWDGCLSLLPSNWACCRAQKREIGAVAVAQV